MVSGENITAKSRASVGIHREARAGDLRKSVNRIYTIGHKHTTCGKIDKRESQCLEWRHYEQQGSHFNMIIRSIIS
jgi:hypothetical protein